MGIAVLVVLSVTILVVMGAMIYGMVLGLSRLSGLLVRTYKWLLTPDISLSREMRGIPQSVTSKQLVETYPSLKCWDVKRCPQESKENCPAYKNRDLPCWLARMRNDEQNRLSSDCLACRLFSLPKLVGDRI